MTAFTDFLDAIRDWAIRKDWTDATVTTFLRTAESQIGRTLRVSHQIGISDGLLATNKVSLPVDWRELDVVRINDGKPLLYKSRNDFYNEGNPCGHYTIVGNTLLVGGTIDEVDGLPVEISYYKSVPKFVESDTWLSTYYYDIYLQKCLAIGALYSQEVEQFTNLSAFVDNLIFQANDEHKVSKVSGSVLRRPRSPQRIG